MNEQTPTQLHDLVDENRLLKQRLELAEKTSIALRASLDLKADLLIKANTERDYFRAIAHDLVGKAEMITTLATAMVQAAANNARAMVPPEPPPTEPEVIEIERSPERMQHHEDQDGSRISRPLDVSQLAAQRALAGGAGAPVDLDEERERANYQRTRETLR